MMDTTDDDDLALKASPAKQKENGSSQDQHTLQQPRRQDAEAQDCPTDRTESSATLLL